MIAAIYARTSTEQHCYQRLLLTMLGGLALMMNGCTDISTRLQPEDTSVNKVLQGSDCVGIYFGFGLGTATIDQAKANTRAIGDPYGPLTGLHITKVRSIEYTERNVLAFGSRCVDVIGE